MSLEPPDPCPSHTMSLTLAQKGPCGLYRSDGSAGVEHYQWRVYNAQTMVQHEMQ